MQGRASVGILGAGRQALETSGYCIEIGLEPAFFVEEQATDYSRTPDDYGAPILTFGQSDLLDLVAHAVITAVGSPEIRERFVNAWPGTRFTTVISPSAWVARDAEIGQDCTIAPRVCINRLARLGSHTLANVGAIISHDVVVDDYATIGPGAIIGGGSSIGCKSFLGLGAVIRDHIHVGDNVVVGAGAVVVADVPPGSHVVGIPARPVH